MRVKSMQEFRRDFKMSKNNIKYEYWDENFMGYMHGEMSGLFALFHGTKDDVEGLLAMPTEMAEDGQAVYEFIQNAADSNSTHFYMFYNEKYLITINNGSVFDKGGITSILNLGQSYNKKHDPDKIGRFGIGFKLVHRLVGTTSGLDEIIKEYKGPQLFSWSKKQDFLDFINSEQFVEDGLNNDLPWLMKIMITCFPSSVDEKVRDLDFNEKILYQRNELIEFQEFLRENIDKIDLDVLNQGTMVFIKLGDGKQELLNKDQDDINSRLENTLYFLKNLKNIQVNDKVIQRQEDFILEEKFIIYPEEEDFSKIGITDKRDIQFPVVLQFGYNSYNHRNLSVKAFPNFYKYFPMEDTTYNLQFIFHSNVFSIGSNRRHIHEHSINAELLKLLAKKIQARMNDHILNNSKYIYDIFANIILSDCNKQFVSDNLMQQILSYISEKTPTDDGDFINKEFVIIKNTLIKCNPSDFGIEKKWFKWNKNSDSDSILIREVQNVNKLNLKSYSLKRLLEEGQVPFTNKWIENLQKIEYELFIKELEDNIPTNISQLKFIKLESGDFKSINEILNDNIILKFPKIKSIEDVLRSLNYTLTESDFENYPILKSKISESIDYIKEDAEVKLYEKKIVLSLPESKLTPSDKKALFLCLKSFKNIGDATLSDKLLLFCNNKNEKCLLSELINPQITNLEAWLLPYCIVENEVFDEISTDKYLRNHSTIFNHIIVPNWNDITSELEENSILSFYQSVDTYYKRTVNPLSIKSKPIVYCVDKGWMTPGATDLFYHSELANFNHYTDLYEIFDEIGACYPPKSIIALLATEPFGSKNSPVENLICSGLYQKETIVSLIEFCKGKLNVFEYGSFHKNPAGIEFKTDEEYQQYYTDKLSVDEYVEKYCSDRLFSLPIELSSYKDYVVLKGEKLYKEIIDLSNDNWTERDEVLIQLIHLIIDSGLKDIAKQFVSNQKNIKLAVSDLTDSDITFSWLQLICSVFESNELESIKEKILIDGVRLSELSWNNTVTLKDEGAIELGFILNRFEDTKVASELKEQLLKTNKFDSNKINAIFQSNIIPNDTELKEIAVEMLGTESNQLKNVDQLRLVIYLYRNHIISSIDNIKVLAINGEWHPLADDWYLKEASFINDNAVLDKRYESIGKKYFGVFSTLLKPYFHREKNSFICPHLKAELSGVALISFFELIKEQVFKNAQNNVTWLNSLTESIGFTPNLCVFAEEKYISDNEKLPTELIAWAQRSKDNANTLTVIGVHGEESPILKLRKHLLAEVEEYSFEGFSKNSESDKFLLKNSLDIMANAEIEFDEEIGTVLKQITEYVGANYDISEILLPIGIKVTDGLLISKLLKVDSAYHLSLGFQAIYNSFKIGLFTDFVQLLIDNGLNVVDPDFLSKEWLNNYTSILEFNDSELDIETLEEDSEDCDLPQYISWKENTESEIVIKFIKESIPYIITLKDFEEEFLIQFKNGDFHFNDKKKILYTKKDNFGDAINELNDIIESDDFNFLKYGSALAISSQREIELLKEIESLREKLNNIEPEKSLERGGLEVEKQIDWNLEARTMLKSHLMTITEFDCSGWNDNNRPSSVVKGVMYQGKPCTWIVRSAMSDKSQFHLTPYEWTLLESKNTFMALRINHEDIKIYGINEDIRKVIFENNHTINLNFDSDMLSFEGIDGLAKMLVHFGVWGSGLVFKNPDYSAGDSFKDLAKCKEGIINKLSDDVL